LAFTETLMTGPGSACARATTWCPWHKRVAGVGLGERDERDDVAGARFFDRFCFSANISTIGRIFSRLPRVCS